jgi:hypothetical protein
VVGDQNEHHHIAGSHTAAVATRRRPFSESPLHVAVDSPVSERLTIVALLLLTFATGIVDAISLLILGHVFVANMTGNTIVLGFQFIPSAGVH